jgi:hypothetical protein
MSRYERIAGTEDAMILREALEKLSKGTLSSDLGDKLDMLITELREARIQREGELKTILTTSVKKESLPPALDVESLVAKIYNLTNTKPTYHFSVERDSSGRLKGIRATPEETR